MDLAVALDVGGTKIASALVGPHGLIGPTSDDATDTSDEQALLAQIPAIAGARLKDAGGRQAVAAVGLAVAGLVEQPGGVIKVAPNLPLKDVALAERLWSALGIPVVVDNDANAAALAESRLGAGRGLTHLVCLTLGTGIGGGIIIDGRLYRGAGGLAGEIGHVVVEPEGPMCSCGRRGHLEAVASGRAIEREAREQVAAGRESLIVELAGGDPGAITGRLVADAGRRGDALARGLYEKAGRYIGMALAGVVGILQPEIVVLGGGLMESGDLLLDAAREAMEEFQVGSDVLEVPIVAAELGPRAGVIGAGLVALESQPR